MSHDAAREALLLAAETGIDPRTVKRWQSGDRVMEANRRALEDARTKLAG